MDGEPIAALHQTRFKGTCPPAQGPPAPHLAAAADDEPVGGARRRRADDDVALGRHEQRAAAAEEVDGLGEHDVAGVGAGLEQDGAARRAAVDGALGGGGEIEV